MQSIIIIQKSIIHSIFIEVLSIENKLCVHIYFTFNYNEILCKNFYEDQTLKTTIYQEYFLIT